MVELLLLVFSLVIVFLIFVHYVSCLSPNDEQEVFKIKIAQVYTILVMILCGIIYMNVK